MLGVRFSINEEAIHGCDNIYKDSGWITVAHGRLCRREPTFATAFIFLEAAERRSEDADASSADSMKPAYFTG
jgi:hypothetical protein